MERGDSESGARWPGRKNGTNRPGRDDLVRDGFGATSPGTIWWSRAHMKISTNFQRKITEPEISYGRAL